MATETAQTLHRGLEILQHLAAESRGLTVTEVAERIGVTRTIAHRLVATLVQDGFCRRGEDGRHHIGLGVLPLAAAVQPTLRETALPILRALAEELGSTAHLTILDGADALAVAVVEPSWTDFHVAYRVGARHPVTEGAAGKAILLADAAADTDHQTPSYAVTRGELQRGAAGLAAPVRGVAGLRASIGIITMHDFDETAAAARVTAAASELSALLAGEPRP